MIIPIAAGLVENFLKIDIRWLYIPVGVIALLLVIEIIRVIVRHNKNKGVKNPLDAIDDALELEGHGLDELIQANEYIFEVENGKLMPPYSASASPIFEGASEAFEPAAKDNGADNTINDDEDNTAAKDTNADNTTADSGAGNAAVKANGADNTVNNDSDRKLIYDKVVVVKSKKEQDKTIYTAEIKYVGKDTVVLPKCFESRLKLASFELKSLYSDLKNILLSFSGVYSRMLNAVEVFRKNGVWARIRIKAKSLYLYLNIRPEEVKSVKFKTAEGVRGFESTPTEIKISGSLKLRKSEELIGRMFENAKIPKNPQYEYKDFTAYYPELDNAVMDNVNIKRLDEQD